MHLGFTLAEVLVTLGIIGIVAALTIPTLVANYRKKVVVSKLKKVYSDLQQAVKLSEADNGTCDTWDWASFDNWYESDSFGQMYLYKYMKNIGKISHSLAIGSNGDWYPNTLNGTKWFRANVIHTWNDMFLAVSGLDVSISGYSSLMIFVDIDGLNGTNTLGKDVFLFQLNENGKIFPYCLNLNSRDAIKKKGESGECGAALIMMDGWEISKDYPAKI